MRVINSMKHRLIAVILCAFFLCLVVEAQAQERTISGRITDESGEAIPGASVIVKGTSKGTISDFDGKFRLSATDANTLVVSFLGYENKEIVIGARTVVDVELSEDVRALEEIVVVGYGTQKRAEVTGAIASVSGDALTGQPVATLDQALQGRAAGVTVINNGSPGTAATIRIRGIGTVNNNEPLYVIDGVIASGIGELNPNDVESMQVLKDASTTAVYGAKGSNGVIIITTKRGQSGKVSVSLNSYAGTQWNNNRYDVLNTDQYIKYATDAFGAPPRFSDPSFAALRNNNTNWQDEIIQSGFVQNHNVAISGGGENSSFRLSGGYLSQDGIIKETGYERYNFRANSNYQLGNLKVGESLSLSSSTQNPLQDGSRSILEHAIKMAPYFTPYNVNNLGGFQGPNSDLDGQDAENPLRILELNTMDIERLQILGNVFAEYEIVKGLTFKTQVGLEYSTQNYSGLFPSYDDDSDKATHARTFAQIDKNNSTLQTVLFTNSLNYVKTFAEKHNVGLLILAEKTNTETEAINMSSRNYLADDINQVSNTNANLSSNASKYVREGYLARLNYNYASKYLFSASIRRDASSRFGSNKRWANFKSISGGWVVSEENFMKGNAVLSNLKIRGSWGTAGNDNIPEYRYSTAVNDNFHYPIGGSDAQGAVPAGLSNPDLRWEEKIMTNIGFDAGILNDQITISGEFFNNESSGLLMPRQLPLSSGFDDASVFENVGSMETRGIELVLGYNDFEGNFTWSANLNLGTSKNKVLSLGENKALEGLGFENEFLTRSEPGASAFQFYGWQFDGIFQNQPEVDAHAGGSQGTTLSAMPGDFRIVDTNKDGVINADDRVFIGNPFPKMTAGFNLSAFYKGFDASIFINGVYGNDVYNTNIYDLEGMTRLFNAGTAVLDRWTAEGGSNTVPRAGGAATNFQASSRFVEDGSFTRLRNVTLGYDLTSSVLKGKLAKCRIYITGQNLLTITNYSGLDPEIGAYTVGVPNPIGSGANNVNGSGQSSVNYGNGVDLGNYPMPKSFIVGLDLTF